LKLKIRGTIGVCFDIPPAKMTLPQNNFGLCVLNHARAGGG
jgi:hypothetical protein